MFLIHLMPSSSANCIGVNNLTSSCVVITACYFLLRWRINSFLMDASFNCLILFLLGLPYNLGTAGKRHCLDMETRSLIYRLKYNGLKTNSSTSKLGQASGFAPRIQIPEGAIIGIGMLLTFGIDAPRDSNSINVWASYF